ncbi:MAG: M56 family metallopeptidase [Melioribacteraceae bacterium]|nr:M56 family metallopeptidase [Melioribacteraceae bacterium]
MKFLDNIIPESIIEASGWMIVHSLWQGALVALLLTATLLLLNKKSSRVRYITAVEALLLLTAMSVRTFVDHYNTSVETTEMSRSPIEVAVTEPNNQTTNNSITNNATTSSALFTEISGYFNQHFHLIVTVYLLGVLFLTLKLTGGFLYSQRLKHHRIIGADNKFKKIVENFSHKLNVKQKVNLVESALVKVPLTLGYFKPIILFPVGLLNGMSYQQVEAIIAHELAHIKQADYLVNLMQSIVEVIFFYHPAVWWISSIIREERENICDDLALEVSDQPTDLMKALVYISQFNSTQPNLAMSSIGNKNTLKRRVNRMMGENKYNSIKSKVYSASLLLLMIISFGAIACSTANGETYYQDKTNLIYEEDLYGDHRYIDTGKLEDDLRTYIFYKRFDGEKSKWEATIERNEIVQLHKDGDEVPQDEFYKYENMILDEVDDIDWEIRALNKNLAGLKKDLKNIKVDLGEDFAKDMKRLAEDIKIEFDSDEFREEMKQLKKDLEFLHEDDFPFDKKEFREEMSELREELRDMKFDFNFEWDSDEFRKEMKELSRELSNIKVDVDLSGLKEGMIQLREGLKDLDIDMSELKAEMKILKNFLNELKDEMISDGILDDGDNLHELEFDDKAMYVNGKKVPHELYLKYIEIYKDHYGESPDDNSMNFRNSY